MQHSLFGGSLFVLVKQVVPYMVYMYCVHIQPIIPAKYEL